jgi:hypothetical protein
MVAAQVPKSADAPSSFPPVCWRFTGRSPAGPNRSPTHLPTAARPTHTRRPAKSPSKAQPKPIRLAAAVPAASPWRACQGSLGLCAYKKEGAEPARALAPAAAPPATRAAAARWKPSRPQPRIPPPALTAETGRFPSRPPPVSAPRSSPPSPLSIPHLSQALGSPERPQSRRPTLLSATGLPGHLTEGRGWSWQFCT